MKLLLQNILFVFLFLVFHGSLQAQHRINGVEQEFEQESEQERARQKTAAPVVSLLPFYEVNIQKDIPFGKALRHKS